MTATTQRQLGAYAKTNMIVKSDREAERDVIGLVTARLRAAAKSDDQIVRARALADNSSMWSIFVSDLSSDGNQLQTELRAQIVSVGLAVIRESKRRDTRAVDFDFLIEVNQNIMDGLGASADRQPQRVEETKS